MATKKPKVTEAWKAQAIAKGKGDGAPVVTQESYKSTLMAALGYYNTNAENAARANAARRYIKALSKENNGKVSFRDVLFTDMYKVMSDLVPDYELINIGSLCMIMENNGYVSPIHQSDMQIKLYNIYNKYNVPQVEDTKPKAPVIPIDQRMIESARALSEDIDYAIDTFFKTKTINFSTKNHLLANNASTQVAKKISDYYKNTLDELNEAIEGKDEQLVEGYSHLTKSELKKFRDFVQSIIDDCAQLQVVVRKPRIQKAKPPGIIVKKLKYMKEFEPLGLKSILPTDIVGCNELWVYNTKQRKLISYEGADGYALTVKGSKIINFSTTKSQSRTLRDPLKFFKELDIGKRNINNAVKFIKTKTTVPNGRMTEDIIILGAFK
jgi:hypothetical protein